MGWTSTRWEASYQGHNITVSRNELTKGFKVEWDGREIAHRTWSWIGLGELHGSAELGDKHVDVHVTLDATLKDIGTDGQCRIAIDGAPIAVKHIR